MGYLAADRVGTDPTTGVPGQVPRARTAGGGWDPTKLTRN
jgi:hypothetical protein